jgi:hypothetical protein
MKGMKDRGTGDAQALSRVATCLASKQLGSQSPLRTDSLKS